jgi:hypothetical protein
MRLPGAVVSKAVVVQGLQQQRLARNGAISEQIFYGREEIINVKRNEEQRRRGRSAYVDLPSYLKDYPSTSPSANHRLGRDRDSELSKRRVL